MMDISKREFLIGAGTALVAAAIPTVLEAATPVKSIGQARVDARIQETLTQIKDHIRSAARNYIYHANDQFTRHRITYDIMNRLTEMVHTEYKPCYGLYQWNIICNETNNPIGIISANDLKVRVYLKMFGVYETYCLDYHFLEDRFDMDVVKF